MPTTLDDTLLRDLYGTDAMREVFDSEQLVQRWLDAEAALALARAEAGVGSCPPTAAAHDRRRVDAARYDLDVLRERHRRRRQHPLVPA